MTKELRIKHLVGFKLLTPDGKIYIQKLIIVQRQRLWNKLAGFHKRGFLVHRNDP